MANRKNLFDLPVRRDLRVYDDIRQTATGPGDDLQNWLFTRLSLFQRLL